MGTFMNQHQFNLAMSDPQLDPYTVVRMARNDWVFGRYLSAFTRLRVDADKIRMHRLDLYTALCEKDLPKWAVDKE